MKINIENFKQEIRKSLEGLTLDYQWDKQRTAFCIEENNRIYLGTATEYISELFSKKEQKKFWKLTQKERDEIANNLADIYDEIWCECYEEYCEYYKEYKYGKI